jgi:glycosyltransferase involved in cell wall biosynthesis
MSDLRLVYLCTQLTLGGAERHASVLAPALLARGFDVTVIALRDGGPLLTQLHDQGVRATSIGMRSRFDLRRAGHALAFAKPSPDIVLTQSVNAHAVGRILARRSNAIHVAIEHGGHRLGMARHQRLLTRALARNVDGVIAVSPSQLPDLVDLGYEGRETRVIPNGIPDLRPSRPVGAVRAELGLRPDDFVAVLVAGLRPEKRIDLFIDSIGSARQLEPRIKGVVVGGGAALTALREYAARAEGVSVIGERADVVEIVADADVLCLTSRTEGMPVSILEGMALAKPIVATAVGGIPGVVVSGRTGILVDSDRADAFGQALAGLARAPERAIGLGRAGRELYETMYTIEHMADAYASFIRELRQGRGAR